MRKKATRKRIKKASMKNKYLLLISIPILAITFAQSGLFDSAKEILEETAVDESKIYEKAKNIAHKYFMKLHDAYKNKNIKKWKKEVDKLKKANKDNIDEFGKISVYFTKAYHELIKELKPKDADKFNSIKKTPDQMADKLFSLGANPFELKKSAEDAAGSLGISKAQWDKMLDDGKAEARS